MFENRTAVDNWISRLREKYRSRFSLVDQNISIICVIPYYEQLLPAYHEYYTQLDSLLMITLF